MKKNKFTITFVYPDFENIGIEYLMSLCLKSGHKIKLVYYKAENAYLLKKQKQISFKSIALKVIKTKPDLVVFSCVTDNFQNQLKVAKAVKKIKPQIKTIFGGVHVTAVPKLVFKNRQVDAVAIGEADISFLEFINKCKKQRNRFFFPNKKIKGVVFKQSKKQIGDFIEGRLIDLNSLPFPLKDPFIKNLNELKNRYSIITSRGCPFNCSYCFQSTMHSLRKKRVFRQRSVENVIDELLWAKNKYSFKIVYFMDDLFTVNRGWILEFLDLYKKKIKLPFGCATHFECMDKTLADTLGQAGCIFISFGVQSLSLKICRNIINRPLDKRKIIHTIKVLKQAGIMVQVDHILGIPGDGLKNQEQAVLFYNKYRPDLVSVFWLTYYPKTPIVETAFKVGILTKKDINKINNGERITKGTFHDGGSMKDPKLFYSIQLLLNYLAFLPKFLINFLIQTKLYKVLKIRNFFLSTALPRAVQSIIDKRYFWGRNILISFFNPKD
ncbi:B12-binding domain-containing radical SAM protein [Patescibacteria group bacterium]